MAAPDPVDIRLLTAVAEAGRVALPDLAGRLGMDVRDVAARLAALSTTGLPMIVGVECDPQGIRNAVAAAQAWAAQNQSGPNPVGPSGPHQAPQYTGGHPVPQPQSGGYPVQAGRNTPSGPTLIHSGPHPAPNSPYPNQSGASGPQFVPAPQPQDPMNMWGPPGSAAWARGDQRTIPAHPPVSPPSARTGKIGSKLEVEGAEGERISIQLIEVVDPADFLFTAAGYELQDGERSVVVHTEVKNPGPMPFNSLPDLHLVLVAKDGSTVSKAQVSLSSRPPHRIGVAPGETAGGHTVYVLPESTELAMVRWSPRPGDEQRTLTWDVSDL